MSTSTADHSCYCIRDERSELLQERQHLRIESGATIVVIGFLFPWQIPAARNARGSAWPFKHSDSIFTGNLFSTFLQGKHASVILYTVPGMPHTNHKLYRLTTGDP